MLMFLGHHWAVFNMSKIQSESELLTNTIRRIPNCYIKTTFAFGSEGVLNRTAHCANYFFELFIFG